MFSYTLELRHQIILREDGKADVPAPEKALRPYAIHIHQSLTPAYPDRLPPYRFIQAQPAYYSGVH